MTAHFFSIAMACSITETVGHPDIFPTVMRAEQRQCFPAPIRDWPAIDLFPRTLIAATRRHSRRRFRRRFAQMVVARHGRAAPPTIFSRPGILGLQRESQHWKRFCATMEPHDDSIQAVLPCCNSIRSARNACTGRGRNRNQTLVGAGRSPPTTRRGYSPTRISADA